MTLETTTKVARLGARLEALGRRHYEVQARIAGVESRPIPDELVLARLRREQRRLSAEMDCYEGVLRIASQSLPQVTAAE